MTEEITGVYRRLFPGVMAVVLTGCASSPSEPATGQPPPAEDRTPASLAMVAGNGQSASPGTAVPIAPAVRVTNRAGDPLAGIVVDFTVSAGAGTVSGSPATTGADGVAAAGWTLGNTVGTNQLRATVGSLSPVTFTATAVSGFDIVLRYLTSATTAQRQAFDAAAARWEGLILGDLPDVLLNALAGQCGSGSPAVNETVDDLVIFVTLEPIDGPGGTLGVAGPCFVRAQGGLPSLGQMRFDTADLTLLETSGDLGAVILHEMAHVLGFGTLWSSQGLLASPALSGGSDPHFTGTQAVAAFDAIGGSGYTGAKVPVENTGGSGTADSHWRESVFDTELLTGFLDAARPNPLSQVSVSSLRDLGYVVSAAGADPFTLGAPAPGAPVAGARTLQLTNDVWRGPIYRVDGAGRVVEVLEPGLSN